MKDKYNEFKNLPHDSYKKRYCFKYTDIDTMKLAEAYETLKVQCECSHKEVIPVWKHKTICHYCGRTIRNNSKEYFKYQMRLKMKEAQNEKDSNRNINN